MKLDPEVLKQVFEYLDKIGAKIGMTADMIWPWLVKQQYVEFGLSIGVLAIGLILIPTAIRITKKHHPFDDDLYGDKKVDMKRTFMCINVIAAFALTIIGCLTVIINLPGVLNPEFYALQNLMNMLK
jgi:hypothetical protein